MSSGNIINGDSEKKCLFKDMSIFSFKNLDFKKKVKRRNMSSKQKKRKKYAVKKAVVFKDQLQSKIYKAERKYSLIKERKNI
ncbi:hypothetical protein PORY_000406 [Pneumocystis oryctolagi]|uniref:Uncharacterized protein n=1 Tax=Pneumocystis oryctolagi TaxID=42067 RepID=A0ACB7CFM5_9ASCO|nr:hypothetical protein PORY_000406 [Pneumocystis oryctolagi]